MSRFCLISWSQACLVALALCTSAYAEETKLSTQQSSGNNKEALISADATMSEVLATAYRNEMITRDRYLAFGSKADEEGYGQVGSMFRAIARGEEIHAANMAALISKIDAESQPNSESVVLASTKENLESAVVDQTYEQYKMYPELVKKAKKEKDQKAVVALDHNMAAEPIHLSWYRQALEDLDGYKGNNVDFLVCPKCGNTVRTLGAAKCPICGTSKDKFEKVH